MIDFIGDIHGHYPELVSLLEKMEYNHDGKSYRHPERTVIFTGDYIDRGKQSFEVLELVEAMVDQGQAIALMGNHEFNAVCFHLENPSGGHLRNHGFKNIKQHYKTLKSVYKAGENGGSKKDMDYWVDWFKTLPLYFETKNFRAIHACWNDKYIANLNRFLVDRKIPDNLWEEASQKGHELFDAVEVSLKGLEVALPEGKSFADKDGHKRTQMRAKWWKDLSKNTLGDLEVHQETNRVKTDYDGFLAQIPPDYEPYGKGEIPVFFGHYWLKSEEPKLFQKNICCIDYSVAKKGLLVAYRFDDESELDATKFVKTEALDNEKMMTKNKKK